MIKKIQKVLIILGILIFGLPVLLLIISVILLALPFLTIGFVAHKISETILCKNQDKLKLEHKLMTNRDYLLYKYKVEKLCAQEKKV